MYVIYNNTLEGFVEHYDCVTTDLDCAKTFDTTESAELYAEAHFPDDGTAILKWM